MHDENEGIQAWPRLTALFLPFYNLDKLEKRAKTAAARQLYFRAPPSFAYKYCKMVNDVMFLAMIFLLLPAFFQILPTAISTSSHSTTKGKIEYHRILPRTFATVLFQYCQLYNFSCHLWQDWQMLARNHPPLQNLLNFPKTSSR